MNDENNEFTLIEWLRRQLPDHPQVPLGIGDDAAIVSPVGNCLLATDMLLEGRHFTFPPATPKLAGRKALAVNLSDIAAMGGTPVGCLVSIACSSDRGQEFAKEVLLGIKELADEFQTAIVGGDTNTWDGPLIINVAVWGETGTEKPLLRSAAKPGDWILVTGTLGGSLQGKHLSFTPRLNEAKQLRQAANIHAMIDLSDGLSSDLPHILSESHCGAILEAAAIPISPAAQKSSDGRSPLEHALSDGEDFELLLTVSPEEGRKLLDHSPLSIPLTKIGEIQEAPGAFLKNSNGELTPLVSTGWRHTF